MKLKISSKENKKLLQNFPKDPFSDLTIITKSSKLHLAKAYLSIDSQFFSNLSPQCQQIDLSMLPQAPLISILRSLYGGQLQANSINQLEDFYKIFETLAIEEYKQSLIAAIKMNHVENKQASLFNSIEMLQFCMKNDLLVQEVSNYHFQNKLKILESSKNYLQLSKLSQKSLNYLLLAFHDRQKQKGDIIINHILQNYFNRKNIKPNEYLLKEELIELKQIWEKFHHKLPKVSGDKLSSMSNHMYSSMLPIQSNYSNNPMKLLKHSITTNPVSFNSLMQSDLLMRSQKFSEQSLLDMKIQALTKELDSKNKKIESLREELKNLKKNDKNEESDEEFSDLTLLKGVKKSKKEKEVMLQNEESASIEPAYENAKRVLIESVKEAGTKGKLPSKSGVPKKIFT